MVKTYLLWIKRCWTYTKSLSLCMRVFFVSCLWALAKIFWWFFEKVFKRSLEKTNKEYIFDTDFWKFLCWDFDSYLHIDEDYEPEIQKAIKNLINKNKWKNEDQYLINIWCHVWFYAILLAKKYWYNVLWFEPNPRTFYYLRCNVSLSNLDDKIKLYNIWLGNENSILKFATWIGCSSMAHIINNTQEIKQQHNLWNIIDINVRKFDDLWIEKSIIENTNLIIMDVEWFELNVLKWMENTLKQLKNCWIIIEIWKDSLDKENTLNLMKSLWFTASQIDEENRLFEK